MGKKSLIKSTTKKKTDPKKEGESATKKAAAKTTKKAAAKTTRKATAKKAKPAAKSKAAAKKRSVSELISLKFEPIGPIPAKLAAPKPQAAAPTAPPLITAQDAGEADRLHALLAKKFSMDEVKAAAKAPAEKPAPGPEEASPTPAEMVPDAWIPKSETEPVAEAPVSEPDEAQPEPADQVEAQEVPAEAKAEKEPEPAPQPKADVPPAPEPRPVLKPAQVARKTIVATTPAPKPEPKKARAAVAPAEPQTQPDPVVRTAKIAAAAAALVIFILLAVSAGNSGKYYIKPIDNAIEIWKGDFSPKDKSFYMVLHGIQAPEPQQPEYSKKDIFPIIFNYYIDKSDTLLEVEGLPDFEGIKKYLHEAQEYAISSEMKSAVKERLNTIDRMVLLYKADVAISRNTEKSLESAIEILDDAGRLTSNAVQDEEIAQKIKTAREKIEALKTPAETPPEAAQSEEAATDATEQTTKE